MSQIWRYRVGWSGWQGGPGVSTFYANADVGPAQAWADTVNAFFTTLFTSGGVARYLGVGVRLLGETTVDTIEATNGEMTSQQNVVPTPAIIGTGGNAFASTTGASITWGTGDFIGGRRVRGRTYLVPLGGSAFATDGTLETSFLTNCQAAIDGFIGALAEAVVWHRPTTPSALDGSSHLIATGRVLDHPSILTSRRD